MIKIQAMATAPDFHADDKEILNLDDEIGKMLSQLRKQNEELNRKIKALRERMHETSSSRSQQKRLSESANNIQNKILREF